MDKLRTISANGALCVLFLLFEAVCGKPRREKFDRWLFVTLNIGQKWTADSRKDTSCYRHTHRFWGYCDPGGYRMRTTDVFRIYSGWDTIMRKYTEDTGGEEQREFVYLSFSSMLPAVSYQLNQPVPQDWPLTHSPELQNSSNNLTGYYWLGWMKLVSNSLVTSLQCW